MQNGVRAAIAVTAFLICLAAEQASAEEREALKPLDRPDAASVTVPKLIAASNDDYAYFYKTGVSYEKAFSELDECTMYSLQTHLAAVVPKFVPLGSAAIKSEGIVPSMQFFITYGVVGVLVAAPFIASAENDAADTTNRRCMMYKGYSRYAINRAVWEQIAAGTDAEKLARLALIASGPQPQAGATGP